MNNLLGFAGLGAVATFIASSWSTIKLHINRIISLLIVSHEVVIFMSVDELYYYLKNNYRFSTMLLSKRYQSRKPPESSLLNFIEIHQFNNMLLYRKGEGLVWCTLLSSGDLKITYIRGAFKLKNFLSNIRDASNLFAANRNYTKVEPGVNTVQYIQTVKASSSGESQQENRTVYRDSGGGGGGGNTAALAMSTQDLSYSIRNQSDFVFDVEADDKNKYVPNYVVPSALNPTVKEFIDWSNEDIKHIIGTLMQESYCKGYLLHGPPGTGKSSFVKFLGEIAGGTEINVIQLNNISSKDLIDYFKRIKHRNVFTLIEDIDSVFDMRERVDKSDNRTDLDFATVLNCLSGVDSPKTGFVFVTTNHIEKIDPALRRAGRLDNVIYFGLPDVDVLERMFDKLSNIIIAFFEELREEQSKAIKIKYINRLKVNALDEDTILLLKEDLSQARQKIIDIAIKEEYTTARFQTELKSTIINIYLKYRTLIDNDPK